MRECGKYRIKMADVIEALADVPDDAFDAVLCDPPYGIGFMGKRWDSFDPENKEFAEYRETGPYPHQASGVGLAGSSPAKVAGTYDRRLKGNRAFQAWCAEWAAAVLRVLKPGGMMLVFGGTRTYHRLTCGIEDAGFEVRDCLMFLHGCLSEDTEILVDGEWEPYHKAIAGKHALCYDVDRDEFSWQLIEDIYVYNYCDTAYRIQSDSTDQIVTRNHRCLVERGGGCVFQFAEEAARECEIRVPVLEGLQEMLDDLSLSNQRADSQESILQPILCSEMAPKEKGNGRAGRNETDNMCGLWEGSMESQGMFEACCQTDVFSSVQWGFAGQRLDQTCKQRPGGMDREERSELSCEDEWCGQSSMEGRSDVFSQTWELQADQVRSLPITILPHGSQGWVCDGTSFVSSQGIRPLSSANGNSSSHRSRSAKQQSEQSATLFVESSPQVVRASRHTRADLARITPIFYQGIVWCVRVPTGAFVARRNGKMFVTGNSGFPKSHDISKAIDKAAGAEREVVGKRQDGCGNTEKSIHKIEGFAASRESEFDITTPATPAAKQWSGFGTALKPSWEPIVLAMKPLSGTFAQNAIEHGVAGINVDGTRIGTAQDKIESNRTGHSGKVSPVGVFGPERMHAEPDGKGRWPANLILSHHEKCVQVGMKRVKGTPDVGLRYRKGGGDGPSVGLAGTKHAPDGYADADGLETVEEWKCHPDCPVGMLDEQSGVSGGTATRLAKRERNKGWCNSSPGEGVEALDNYGDTGTASRFFYCAKASRGERNAGCGGLEKQNNHPTVKPLALCKYLATLILPPKRKSPRRILVPFAGSGSEMIGALLAGWDRVYGIEKEGEYVTIAKARLAWWRKRMQRYGVPLDPERVLGEVAAVESGDAKPGGFGLGV